MDKSIEEATGEKKVHKPPSVRSTFLRLFGSLGKMRNYLMRIIGPNISPLTATFTYQYSLWSVWWEPIPSTGTIMAVIQKWLLRPRTLILRTRTNQNEASSTKVYCGIVLRTKANQKNALLTKFYRRIVLPTKVNQNAALSEKRYRRTFLRTRTNQNTSSCTKIYRRVVLLTRTNQNVYSCMKLYCVVFLRTRTNQNAASSTKFYGRTVPRKRTK